MPKRVAVHVTPELLSEGLLLELRRRSFTVTPIHLPGNDVAVVSAGLKPAANVIITLAEDNVVAIEAGEARRRRSCRSVDELVSLIHEFSS